MPTWGEANLHAWRRGNDNAEAGERRAELKRNREQYLMQSGTLWGLGRMLSGRDITMKADRRAFH